MRIVHLLLSVFLLSLGTQLKAQNEEIQSAIFFYLSNYIEWPANKNSGEFVIGVVGKDPIVPHLKKLANEKKLGKRSIVIKEFENVKEAAESHIVFLADKKLDQFGDAKAIASSMGFLLVTDVDGYGQKGSAINFTLSQGKTGYQINQSAIASAGLKASNKLLALGSEI